MYFFLLSLIPHFVVLPVAAIFSLWMFLPSIDPHWYDIDVWSFQWLTSSFFLIQMLAQDQSARDAESLVINNFNTKLVAKISSFKSNNTGVNSFLLCWPFMCVSGTQYMIYSLGLNLHLGLSHPIHHDFGLSHYLWVWRCHVLWEWI